MTWTVRVVCSSAAVVAGAPVMAAAEEKAAAALLERAATWEEARVLVRTVVETGVISVVTEPRAGQSVIEAAQDVTV